jgi:UDPglucose 6-dehydrogenase
MDLMPSGFDHPDCGHQRVILCPYHLWSYDLTGKLVGAPEMQKAACWDRSEVALHSFRSEIWEGFIFVTLSPDTPPLAEKYARLKDEFVSKWDINSAELIKHAANSFLALKISYANALSEICEAAGADVIKVTEGIGTDKRIGRAFLNAGLGYGGSCFPKDIAAFIAIARQLGSPFGLLEEVQRINDRQFKRFLDGIREALWVLKEKKLAIWGLSFKPNTDDVRSSTAIRLVEAIVAEGAEVTVFDPKAMEKARELPIASKVKFAESALEAAADAEALIIATEWPEFAAIDLALLREAMRTPLIFDGRNLIDPIAAADFGFQYRGIGRGAAVERS